MPNAATARKLEHMIRTDSWIYGQEDEHPNGICCDFYSQESLNLFFLDMYPSYIQCIVIRMQNEINSYSLEINQN